MTVSNKVISPSVSPFETIEFSRVPVDSTSPDGIVIVTRWTIELFHKQYVRKLIRFLVD